MQWMLVALLPCLAQAAPFAYIGNTSSTQVTVIDTADDRAIATIDVGEITTGVAVNPSGTRAYIANGKSLFAIDTVTNRLLATVTHGTNANIVVGIAVAPDGNRIYLSGGGPSVIFDASTLAIVGHAVRGEGGIAVHPDGSRAYLAQWSGDSVAVIDAVTGTTIANIGISGPYQFARPFGLAIDPQGRWLYVGNNLAYNPQDSYFYTSVVDTVTNRVIANVPTGYSPGRGIAVSPDGTRVYTGNGGIIDTATNAVVGHFSGGRYGMAFHPDGSRLYIADDFPTSQVRVVSTVSNADVAAIPVQGSAMAFGQFIIQGTSNATSVIEFYSTSLDHYFITWMPGEIAILDAGTQIKGWMRTGYTFKTYTSTRSGTSPVCRYYIPPGLGDSHFFGRGTVECEATGQKHPSFVLEDPSFMHMFLPTAGNCPANTTQVYRVFSNRPDANHRYMIDKAVRDQMVVKGWLAEGDGPDLVVMCAPQ